jgi:hypothetical protein
MAPKEAAAIPFPNEETTPPVTNTNRVIIFSMDSRRREQAVKADERRANKLPQPTSRRDPS